MKTNIHRGISADLVITPFTKQNMQEVSDLLQLNMPEYFHPNEEENLMDYLQMHGDNYFIARINNKPIGACGYHITAENEGRISWTFIHPSFKGKGVGKALVCHCLEMIERHPVNKIIVWTSNLSWKFYEKFGFILKTIKKDHWAKGIDLYYMETEKKDILNV